MVRKEDIIGYEIIEGWPIYKMTLKEILLNLGASEINGNLLFELNNPIFNLYPRRLVSDVMGYGIDEQLITGVNTDNKTYINIFTEKPLSQDILDNN